MRPITQPHHGQGQAPASSQPLNRTRSNQSSSKQVQQAPPLTAKEPKSSKSPLQNNQAFGKDTNNGANNDNNNGDCGVISPELLVDALSGQEDGLLAIAERLMEHYDKGYDVMGEAIIDAFADVQKLFQHAVEAAHMEGAAMEANRAREEADMNNNSSSPSPPMTDKNNDKQTSAEGGPDVIEEFVDDDVKDVLREAIDRVSKLQQSHRNKNSGIGNKQQQSMEWYEIYERACNSSSSLLPVDSDHRGRLQLAIARAESVSPDRACALLRYAMEGVMRNGDPTGKAAPIDTTKRSDCVLEAPGLSKSSEEDNAPGRHAGSNNAVLQSNEEQLDSLVAEMKDVLSAPMYEHSPIQFVATRFWDALNNTRRYHVRREELLSQKLGELKGDYLLEKAEWEEKLADSQVEMERCKRAYLELKENSFRIGGGSGAFYGNSGTAPSSPSRGALSEIGGGGGNSSRLFTKHKNDDLNTFLNRVSPNSGSSESAKHRAESVFSQASSMAYQAKKLLACGEQGRNGLSRNTSSQSTGRTSQHDI
jgi:hypothetical protein